MTSRALTVANGPARVNVDGYRRDGRTLTLRYDVDVSGRTWQAQMRRHPNDADAVDLDVTFANGGLDVVVSIPDADLLTMKGGRWSYDVLWMDGVRPRYVVAGDWLLPESVTR